MRSRRVIYQNAFLDDLEIIADGIAEVAGYYIPVNYVDRIDAYRRKFDLAAGRGTRRDDIRQDLCVISFEGRVTLLFLVTDEAVIFLRVFYGGQDWEEELSGP